MSGRSKGLSGGEHIDRTGLPSEQWKEGMLGLRKAEVFGNT